MKEIHNRMPVILKKEHYEQWLQTGQLPPEALSDIFKPFPPDKLEGFDVSPRVSSPANNSPDNIEPLEPEKDSP